MAATAATVPVAVKVHLVFDHYMEWRWQHRPLRQMLATWRAVVMAIPLGGYWAA